MCIIAAKPVGIEMPTDEIIENMWYGNSDGAGFMYAKDGFVHIRKGFMRFGDFCDAIDALAKENDLTELPLVMHFRITTHGGTKPENCHPFPISDSVGVLSKLDSRTKLGVAHNGIINITPRKGISDTMEYIATQLAPLHRAVPDFYRNKDLMQMIENAIHSRMAFLTSKGDIYTIGEFVEDKGIKYSNTSYKWGGVYRKYSCSSSVYGGWDTWDDYAPDIDDYLGNASEGYFCMSDVMWLDEDFGYITGTDNYEPDEMYAIDKDMTVYRYDYALDCLIKVPGATAWSNTGTIIRYDPNAPATIREQIFVPYSKPISVESATSKALKKGKKNKK